MDTLSSSEQDWRLPVRNNNNPRSFTFIPLIGKVWMIFFMIMCFWIICIMIIAYCFCGGFSTETKVDNLIEIVF